MGPALREAWLWLLLAFVLGVVIGYFLRRYTVAEDTPDAGAPDPDASLAQQAEEEIAEAERADAETADDAEDDDPGVDGAGEPDDEAQPNVPATEDEGVEPKTPEAAVVALRRADLSEEERELLEKDAAAFHALAQLSQGQLTDSHGVTRVVQAEDPAQVEEAAEEHRPLGEAPPEQHVDTHQTFMPVVEPLRVPGGRSQLKTAQATEPEPAPEAPMESSVEAETPADGADTAAPTAPAKRRKPRRRDS